MIMTLPSFLMFVHIAEPLSKVALLFTNKPKDFNADLG